MKYPPRTYAKALAEAAASVKERGDADRVVGNFLALLARNGDRGSLRKILPLAERMLLARSGGRRAVVESARPLSAESRAAIAKALRGAAAVEERTVPALVAGVRIIVNDERQLDGSLAHALNKLFK